MRESFGGVFIIKLLLVFIVVYVSFMAVAINYAKAFRVKNQVINIVEQYQYIGSSDIDVIEKIEKFLVKVPYTISGIDCGNDVNNESIKNVEGVCIEPMISMPSTEQYYKITTYIKIDFPFFGIKLVIPISGETKMIYTS